jgi:hypothetical protein
MFDAPGNDFPAFRSLDDFPFGAVGSIGLLLQDAPGDLDLLAITAARVLRFFHTARVIARIRRAASILKQQARSGPSSIFIGAANRGSLILTPTAGPQDEGPRSRSWQICQI